MHNNEDIVRPTWKHVENETKHLIDNTKEIKNYGDAVIIRTVPDINIHDYVPGMTLVHQHPASDPVTMYIDQAHYFDFVIDDIHKAQTDLSLVDKWSGDASEKLKIKIDTNVLGTIPADVHASNKGAAAGAKSGAFNLGATGSPVTITKSNVVDYIVHLGTVADEANWPESGRWVVLPPLFANMIKRSDLKDASLSGDGTSMLRNGRLGMIDRFVLYQSNLVASVTDGADTVHKVMAGHKDGLTFAAQMSKSETLRGESTFGDIIRGLTLYGFKVVKPEALALLYAKADIT